MGGLHELNGRANENVDSMMLKLIAPAVSVLLLLPSLGRSGPSGSAQNLAPYIATPEDVVQRMLTLAEVTRQDVVYDLGCGDG